MTPSLILVQFFTPLMYFQWEGLSNSVTMPVGRLWQLMANTARLRGRYKSKVEKWYNPYFAP